MTLGFAGDGQSADSIRIHAPPSASHSAFTQGTASWLLSIGCVIITRDVDTLQLASLDKRFDKNNG